MNLEQSNHQEDWDAYVRRLDQLREIVVASGEPPLSWEELEREVAERRGDSGWTPDG